jgi:hypothetical protein
MSEVSCAALRSAMTQGGCFAGWINKPFRALPFLSASLLWR